MTLYIGHFVDNNFRELLQTETFSDLDIVTHFCICIAKYFNLGFWIEERSN